jgi:D-tyrosyl-tRNA(Tyr) deacylase
VRAVIQRVSHASVVVEGETVGDISAGLLVFLGIGDEDSQEDIDWLSPKIVNMRIFPDDQGVMNRSLIDVEGEILIISQFTLHASTKKGNRPSYIKAAKPETSKVVYDDFIAAVQLLVRNKVQKGIFGADMKVTLLNDGPVTIIIDSKNRI